MQSASAIEDKSNTRLRYFLKNTDLVFTFCLFGIILLLIVPVTPVLLDLLLAASIGISLLVLLIVVYLKTPAEFSVFPTLLLAITLYRLGLNIASTRLILLDGYAGQIIYSFGNFIVRGNYVVGTVVFLILIVINFVVITKGAGRIAEVAARFTLDAMPGKQMAIDAELNSGLIDEAMATKRRLKIQKEADFYGAMDGASKFVRGDAVAGVLITLINVVGGISIGVLQKGMQLNEALQRYTLLSIGDGLVAQIPALIVSVGAGILITRTGDEVNLGEHLGKQLVVYPRAVGVASAMMGVFAIMPGLPFMPFFVLGGMLAYAAKLLKKHEIGLKSEIDILAKEQEKEKLAKAGGGKDASGVQQNEDLIKLIKTEAFAVELGYGLLTMADPKSNGDLIERITGVRQKFAKEMGIVIPPISVRDNLDLETNQYRFLLRYKDMARGNLVPNRFMAMNVSNSKIQLKGVPTVEPVFGLEAIWIAEEEKQNAEINGYTVVDAPSVLITHLTEMFKDNIYLLLEREDTQKLIDAVKEKNPTLIAELLPDLVSVGIIQRVLQNLLKERISIKNLTLILETIGDYASITKNPDDLSEQVRRRLGIYFIQNYECDRGIIKALTLDPRLEQALTASVRKTQFEVGLMMDPYLTQNLLREMMPRVTEMVDKGLEPIVVTISELRLAFKRFFEPSFPRLVVLSYQELPNQVQVQNYGILTVPLEKLQEASKR